MPSKRKMVRQTWGVAKDRMSRLRWLWYSPQLTDTYLAYQDIIVTWDDYCALKWNEWLTENLIAFYQGFLEQTLLKSQENDILLLRPLMTQMLLDDHEPETVRTIIPGLQTASHIAIIINNNNSSRSSNNSINGGASRGSGTHWSLLMVCLREGLALHYDSMPIHGNRAQAREVTDALGRALDNKSNNSSSTQLEFIHMEDVPVQRNLADCGLYACISMEFVIEHILRNARAGEPDDEYSLSLRGWDINTKRGRQDLRVLMKVLRNSSPTPVPPPPPLMPTTATETPLDDTETIVIPE